MDIAIVDDSKNEQQIIYNAVTEWAKHSHQSINLSIFDSGEDFTASIINKHYNIVFMDIYMKNINGIEAATILRKYHIDTLLIFLTTSTDHMAEAFPCHAFDYIMKPINISRLYKTLDEALQILPENQPYINILFGKQEISILHSDILCILSDSNYCVVSAKDNEYRIRTSFNEFTSQLQDFSEFYVINRGIMINLDNVINLNNYDCIMINQRVFPISRRKKDKFEQALLNRRFEKRRKGEF